MARKAHGSHVPHRPAEWQTHLRAAIENAYGSLNGYAKHLAGENATRQQIDNQRRPMQKWLKVDKPTVPSVQTVSRLLQDGIQIDPAVFPRGADRPRPYTIEELGELVEEAIGNQQSAFQILQQLSANTASAVRQAELGGEAIEGLRNEIESLKGEIQQWRSTVQRRRRAS